LVSPVWILVSPAWKPILPASRPSAASPCLDKGGSAIHIPSIRHPYGCRRFRNLAIAEAAR
jgi:hypothetical protein